MDEVEVLLKLFTITSNRVGQPMGYQRPSLKMIIKD